MGNYYNALVEVDTILNYLDEDEYHKIPTEVMKAIQENKSKDYIFEYDENLELKEQIILAETKAILFNLFRDYLSTPEQREKIIKMQREDRIKVEEQKIKNYEYKELFPRQLDKIKNTKEDTLPNNSSVQMVTYKETLLKRIEKWFKNLFHKIF